MKIIRRSPLFGGILGILFPGLGFMYAGNMRLAIYLNLTFILLTFFFGWVLVKQFPAGIYLNFMLIMAWYSFSFFGSFIYICNNRDITKRSYNRLRYYMLYIICILALEYTFTKHREVLLGYDLNRITGNIGTALLHGDFIISDAKPTDLNIGDIILYEGARGLSVARILKKHDAGFTLDNQYDYRSLIPRTSICGKVIYIWFSWNFNDSQARWGRFPRAVDVSNKA